MGITGRKRIVLSHYQYIKHKVVLLSILDIDIYQFFVTEEVAIVVLPHIDMKSARGEIVVGWLASQTDMLSNDWCILD